MSLIVGKQVMSLTVGKQVMSLIIGKQVMSLNQHTALTVLVERGK